MRLDSRQIRQALRCTRGFTVPLALMLVIAAPVAAATANPVGTWVTTVVYAPDTGIPPFVELLTLHHGGTVTESNALLHPNSGSMPPFLSGGDGQGSWRREPDGMVSVRFLKLVFDGATNQFVGYLYARAHFAIDGDTLVTIGSAEDRAELRFGPDPQNPLNVIPFPPPTITGQRMGDD